MDRRQFKTKHPYTLHRLLLQKNFSELSPSSIIPYKPPSNEANCALMSKVKGWHLLRIQLMFKLIKFSLFLISGANKITKKKNQFKTIHFLSVKSNRISKGFRTRERTKKYQKLTSDELRSSLVSSLSRHFCKSLCRSCKKISRSDKINFWKLMVKANINCE